MIFATNNSHKIVEIRKALCGHIKIQSLSEAGIAEEIPETGTTLEQNALQKATYIFEKYHQDCFADDTGLEIEALDGRPGVYSARYAGEGCNFEDNIVRVLEELNDKDNRKARFRCVIALILDRKNYFFEGTVNGVILKEKHGQGGFGYDPIFLPDGFAKTFAEMTIEEKNKISHRGRAVKKLTEFLLSR